MATDNIEIRGLQIEKTLLGNRKEIKVNGNIVNKITIGGKIIWANINGLGKPNHVAIYTKRRNTEIKTTGGVKVLEIAGGINVDNMYYGKGKLFTMLKQKESSTEIKYVAYLVN